MMYVVNYNTLEVKQVDEDYTLCADDEEFETEFDALAWALSRAKHLEDFHHNEELCFVLTAAKISSRMAEIAGVNT